MQTNRQEKKANKSIPNALNKKLDWKKERWAEEIYNILQSYRTTYKKVTYETPFWMAYGVEYVIPLEMQKSS